jgi:hypothetical protein
MRTSNIPSDDREPAAHDRALQLAWARVAETPPSGKTPSEVQQILADRILKSVSSGDPSPWGLAREALFNLWQIETFGAPLPELKRGRR